MSKFTIVKRLCGAASLSLTMMGMSAVSVAAQDSQSEAMQALVDAAMAEGKLVLYESMLQEEADQIFADFDKAYPGLEFEYVSVGGSQRIARISQESMSGGPTADVSHHLASSIMTLAEQGFIAKTDWEAFGYDAASGAAPNEYMVRLDTPVYVTLYNTNVVPEGDVPQNYDDFLNADYSGKWGTWALPDGLANLVPVWGEDKTREFVQDLAETKPRLYRDHQAAAAAVAAGEVAMAHFIPYQSALPQIAKGAPIAIAFVTPFPATSIYAFVPELAEHPNAGRLFVAWLASPEGAEAFERATGRGSHYNTGTKLGQLTEGLEFSAWSVEDNIERADEINEIRNEFAQILQGR